MRSRNAVAVDLADRTTTCGESCNQSGLVLTSKGGLILASAADFLAYRGVDADNPGVEIVHCDKYRSLTAKQRRWLKRRQAIEPVIGHLKTRPPHGSLLATGANGDAMHAVLCAASYNLRWLLPQSWRSESHRSFCCRLGGATTAMLRGTPGSRWPQQMRQHPKTWPQWSAEHWVYQAKSRNQPPPQRLAPDPSSADIAKLTPERPCLRARQANFLRGKGHWISNPFPQQPARSTYQPR